MHQFASGWKGSYYGKGDVTVYRLNRDPGQGAVFGANVLILIYGDAFWPTYTTGDNTSLIATDSMKNFIQRETLNYAGPDLEDYCRFLSEKFLETYPQVEGLQVRAVEIPYGAVEGGQAFAPAGPERAASPGPEPQEGPAGPARASSWRSWGRTSRSLRSRTCGRSRGCRRSSWCRTR